MGIQGLQSLCILLLLAVLTSTTIIERQLFEPAVCPIAVTVSLIPIEVQTSITRNTIVTVTPGVTLTVTNAPVCISTLATATITTTISGPVSPPGSSTAVLPSSSSASSAVSPGSPSSLTSVPSSAAATTSPSFSEPPPINPSTTFLLAVEPTAVNIKRTIKRQVQNGTDDTYVRKDGFILRGCGEEAQYVITSDRLYISNDAFSVQNSSYSLFTPVTPPGPVDRTFSLENQVLHWRNSDFVGGQALFCNLNGFVAMIFNGVYPDGCPPVRLTIRPLEACPSRGNGTTTTPPGISSSSSTASTLPSSQGSRSTTDASSFPGTNASLGSTSSPSATGVSSTSSAANSTIVSSETIPATPSLSFSANATITTPVSSTITTTPAANSTFPGYLTSTTSYDGPVTSTAVIDPVGGSPGTVIVYVPFARVTSTTGYDEGPGGADTITQQLPVVTNGTAGVTVTVIVSTPYPYQTITEGWSGPTITTSIIPPAPTAFIGTVIVKTPYVLATVTTSYDAGPGGTAIITSTVLPTGAGSNGSVVISTPVIYASATVGYDGGPLARDTLTETRSVTDQGGPAVVVSTPYLYVTSETEYDQGSAAALTRSSVFPASLDTIAPTPRGTVFISYPLTFSTITSGYDGGPTVTQTITSTVTEGTTSVSRVRIIVVSTPYPYITVISNFNTVIQTSTVDTSIITPGPPSFTGTVLLDPPDGFNIVTTGYDQGPGGRDTITVTVAPTPPANGTIIISTPYPYVNLTTQYDAGPTGLDVLTSTIRPAASNTVGTVITSVPFGYATITEGYDAGPNVTATLTTTIAANGTAGGRVVIQTPFAYITRTLGYDGGAGGTLTSAAIIPAASGPPGTVVVYTPYGYITTTLGYDAGPVAPGNGTNNFITRVVPALGGSAGTVFISTPYQYITEYSGTDEGPSGTVSFTSTTAAAGTPPLGTIAIITPYLYITRTVAYPGQGVITAPITTTSPPVPPNNTLGTVEIQTQLPLITITQGYDGLNTTSTTLVLPSGTERGTVAVLTPYAYTTTDVFYDAGPGGTVTQTQSIFPTGTQAVGTIIRSIPYPYVSQTTGYDAGATGGATLTQTILPAPTNPTGTILTSVPFTYLQLATQYDDGPDGTDTITRTILPTGTAPGTIVTSQPFTYQTIVTDYDGGPGAPNSTSLVRPSGNVDGTLFLYNPDPYVTITTAYDAGPSGVATLVDTTPASLAGRTGTIATSTPIIYITRVVGYDAGPRQFQTITVVVSSASGVSPSVVLSTPQPYITITSRFNLAEHSTVEFSTISAGPSGTGTVLIDPPESYVVSFVLSDEGPAGTVRITQTILPSGGNPGTFIITRPYRYVTETAGAELGFDATAPATTTITPNPANTVGTVLIQTPIRYITSTIGIDEGPGGTLVTFSTKPGSSGTAGTYYVETPYPYSTFTTPYDAGVTGSATITVVVSVTNSRFGSLIISTPGAYRTQTTGYDAGPLGRVTSTSVAPPASNADGTGTVYISTPYPYITTISYTDVGPNGVVPPPTTTIISATSVASRIGTLISIVPDRYDTVTVPYQGSGILTAPITSTIRPTSGATVGTVQVLTQPPAITSVVGYDAGPAGGPVTSSTSTGAGVAPTVFVSTAFPYITTTSGNDALTRFTTTVRPTGATSTGSVIVYTHFSAVTTITTTTFFSTGTAFTSTIDVSGTAPDTVIIGYLQTFTTSTTTSGTVGTTITLATPTLTTPGTILDVQPTPNLACNNAGLQYAIQSNPYPRGLAAADPTYSAFVARAFQTIAPQATGVTRFLQVDFVARDTQGYIYGNGPRPITQTAVNHRGYLFAKQGGTFTFNFPISDDISELWIGANATSTYRRSNADIEQLYNGAIAAQDQQQITYTYNLAQGQYIPIRVLWANWNYDGQFKLVITAPDGSVITAGTTDVTPSPFLVQFSCDGVAAPAYPPWGAEGTGL